MGSVIRSCLPWLCAAGVVALEAPPANPPVVVTTDGGAPRSVLAKSMAPLAAPVLGSIGSPTAAEQHYLELINRARATPAAEGTRLRYTADADVQVAYTYFAVDLAMMEGEFAALPAAPPLAFNAQLTTAARAHCQSLYDNNLQSHTGSGGSPLGPRLTAAGYAFSSAGECVYSYAESVYFGHAGFEVDWGGGGSGGMQAGRGHRANLHNAGFQEIGIGVLDPGTVPGKTVG